MGISIALAGNPNSGKTTLFNSLTGSSQFVGNWPGVTVEKKAGKLKNHSGIDIVDLPGIYSLSPYTLEEVVARNFLVDEDPDVILNIVDGTNLERNLYLTTQLTELGIPVVIAVNMMDIVEKKGDHIDTDKLSKQLSCPVVTISALKETGIKEAADLAIKLAGKKQEEITRIFDPDVEAALEKFNSLLPEDIPQKQKRWYLIKIFEKDPKVLEKLDFSKEDSDFIKSEISKLESSFDDDSESIIIDQRYNYITGILEKSYIKKNKGKLTTSDKIDQIVTNRWLALPVFAAVMFMVYFLSVTTVGSWASGFINNGVFGDGFFLFGNGRAAYEEKLDEYETAQEEINAFENASIGAKNIKDVKTTLSLRNEEGKVIGQVPVDYNSYLLAQDKIEPKEADYGIFIPGIPGVVKGFLESVNCADWLQGLILDGIIAGVGAVLGFVPQMFVLFFLLSFLEACGYMSRIAFVMDKLFRKFGLSGKSFIPMLVGTGCGVPGIMASRTIENERDRRMTIITTTFIPCGAKLPVIALIAGALFSGAWWVAPSAYLLGAFAIVTSGIILKKTKMFKGDPAPFVMELPAYHLPAFQSLFYNTWERGWSFIKKAGTVILLASILIWFLSNFGFENGRFGLVDMNNSILALLGSLISFIFIPLGWGNWQSAVATITGLVAKENIVGTFGVLFGGFQEVSGNGWQIWTNMQAVFTPLAAFSFLSFNLLCAPCFAAVGAIRREMNSAKWTWFALMYHCFFAYCISLVIYQLGSWFYGTGSILGTSIALIIIAGFVYLLFRPEVGTNYSVNLNESLERT